MNKTITLPQDDAGAKAMFDDIIQKNPFVLLVVIGLGSEAKDLVQLGDLMAGGTVHPSWRRVVWVQNVKQLPMLMANIEVKTGVLDPRSNSLYGFFIDFHDKVCGVIQNANEIAKGPIAQGFILAEYSK